jgi:hypothetical protein
MVATTPKCRSVIESIGPHGISQCVDAGETILFWYRSIFFVYIRDTFGVGGILDGTYTGIIGNSRH